MDTRRKVKTMYIFRDTKEMRKFLNANIDRLNKERDRLRSTYKKSARDAHGLSHVNGELSAYTHALEMLAGLEKGMGGGVL